MVSVEQEQRILKAKVAVMLYNLLDRVPEAKEINRAFLLIRVMSKARHSLHPKA
ncbi:MAG TPA: hypothetical protein VFV38_23665 [Ktedonobacteraceae bacterium]|nr:hypothetical protein [Ktedonobacteraceae bacterium]